LDQPGGYGLTPLTIPGTVSKAGFQDFRIRVGISSSWRTVVREGQGLMPNLSEQQTFSPAEGLEIQGNSSTFGGVFCSYYSRSCA